MGEAMNKFTEAELLAAIKGDKVEIPKDKLDKIRALARAMRLLSFEIEDTKQALTEKNKKMFNLEMKELPDLFQEYNIPSMTIGAEGNMPEVELESKPYYKAVLPRDEDDRVKKEGLSWLKKNHHGDLIKRVFTIQFPMDADKQVLMLQKFLKSKKLQYEVTETVPWTSLTAFVKEMIEKRNKKGLPLEILGATVGRIVRMKVKKK
jgi:hypothetical protein